MDVTREYILSLKAEVNTLRVQIEELEKKAEALLHERDKARGEAASLLLDYCEAIGVALDGIWFATKPTWLQQAALELQEEERQQQEEWEREQKLGFPRQ